MLGTRVCTECVVRDSALCSALSDDELVALCRIGQRRHVARNETIMWAGDDSVICANLLEGIMKLSASASDGRE